MEKVYDVAQRSGYDFPLVGYQSGEKVFHVLIGSDDFVESFIDYCSQDDAFFKDSAWGSFDLAILKKDHSIVQDLVSNGENNKNDVFPLLTNNFNSSVHSDFIDLCEMFRNKTEYHTSMSVREFMKKVYSLCIFNCLIIDHDTRQYNDKTFLDIDSVKKDAAALFYSLNIPRHHYSDYIFSQTFELTVDYYLFYNDIFEYSEYFSVRTILDKIVMRKSVNSFNTILDGLGELCINLSNYSNNYRTVIGKKGFNSEFFWRNITIVSDLHCERKNAAIIADWLEEEVSEYNEIRDSSNKQDIFDFFDKVCFAAFNTYMLFSYCESDEETIVKVLQTFMKVDANKIKKLRLSDLDIHNQDEISNILLQVNITITPYM